MPPLSPETPTEEQLSPYAKNLLAQKDEEIRQLKLELAAQVELATTDALTGLENRRQFEKVLQEKILGTYRNKGKLIVIMLDIDSFKKINDIHGHGYADEVLRGFANIVRHIKRPEDTFARYGGEEFFLIFEQLQNTDLSTFNMDRYREALKAINRSPQGDGDPLTVSMGAVVVDFSEVDPSKGYTGINPDDIKRVADENLYVSKTTGKDKLTLSYMPAG